MSELPSFLQQTAPHAYTLTMSASAAETHMLCPAKYSWSRVTGIEAAAPRAGQNYGKALHAALAHRYQQMGLSISRVEEHAEQMLAKHFAENPQPALGSRGRPEWRTATRAFQAFRAYNAAYPAEDFEVLGVEEPFECELGSFTLQESPCTPIGNVAREPILVSVRFRGIRDLRVRWHDQIWVLDHKTSTEWSDLTIDEGRASFQFMGYAWVERFGSRQSQHALGSNLDVISTDAAEFTPIGGVIGNYLVSREPYSEGRKPTARDLPRDQFERHAYPFSDAQLDEWHSRAMGIARAIFANWRGEDWPQNSTACAHWGKCEYYRLCWETDPAYRLSAALGADYRPRTPSPFEDAENGKERA